MSKRHSATALLPLLSVVLLLGTTNCLAEASLGRLFLTAQQRAQLDQLRQRDPSFWQHDTGETDIGLTLNGEVRSSSGRHTRWINGVADWDNASPLARIPVGNTYHPERGQSDSLLGATRIVVRPAPPTP